MGSAAEGAAADFLLRRGFKLLARNWTCREGEIDLVMKDGDTICFVEVRSRTKTGTGHPLATITGPKQRQVVRVAMRYLQTFGLEDQPVRFDAVGIVKKDGKIKIDHIPNAFQAPSEF